MENMKICLQKQLGYYGASFGSVPTCYFYTCSIKSRCHKQMLAYYK